MVDKPADETFYAKDCKTWRKWLKANHKKRRSIWLIIYRKNATKPSVYYDEAVEEALCFGWIDSTANKRDEESRYQYFCQRKPASKWSKLNKSRVEKLIKQGLMEKAGMAMVELAKQTGTWNALDDIEELVMPPDLLKAFSKDKIALRNFEAFPPSARKGIFQWIINAKQDATRNKRILETVSKASKNVRANQWIPKDER